MFGTCQTESAGGWSELHVTALGKPEEPQWFRPYLATFLALWAWFQVFCSNQASERGKSTEVRLLFWVQFTAVSPGWAVFHRRGDDDKSINQVDLTPLSLPQTDSVPLTSSGTWWTLSQSNIRPFKIFLYLFNCFQQLSFFLPEAVSENFVLLLFRLAWVFKSRKGWLYNYTNYTWMRSL